MSQDDCLHPCTSCIDDGHLLRLAKLHSGHDFKRRECVLYVQQVSSQSLTIAVLCESVVLSSDCLFLFVGVGSPQSFVPKSSLQMLNKAANEVPTSCRSAAPDWLQ